MRVYLDTSAAMKLIVEEAESVQLERALSVLESDVVLISSWLLHTELNCAAVRMDGIDRSAIAAVLDPLVLLDLERSDLINAPRLGPGLRSQDAIHLTVAVRAAADTMFTYDREQASAARAAGLTVSAPGASAVLE